jgi:Tol biopolymer transport system component
MSDLRRTGRLATRSKELAYIALSGTLAIACIRPPFCIAAQQDSVNQTGNILPLVPARHLQFDEHEGTWVSLDVSPDGQTIVFELLGDLYDMSITGGEARCVLCGLPFASQPAYSPDGSMITFIRTRFLISGIHSRSKT